MKRIVEWIHFTQSSSSHQVNEDMPLAGDVNFKKLPSGSPEALLELLNKDNNQMFRGNMGSIDREEDLLMQKFNKQRPKYERGKSRLRPYNA